MLDHDAEGFAGENACLMLNDAEGYPVQGVVGIYDRTVSLQAPTTRAKSAQQEVRRPHDSCCEDTEAKGALRRPAIA